MGVCRASSTEVAQLNLTTAKCGSCTVRGTSRKINEDRLDYQVRHSLHIRCSPPAFSHPCESEESRTRDSTTNAISLHHYNSREARPYARPFLVLMRALHTPRSSWCRAEMHQHSCRSLKRRKCPRNVLQTFQERYVTVYTSSRACGCPYGARMRASRYLSRTFYQMMCSCILSPNYLHTGF